LMYQKQLYFGKGKSCKSVDNTIENVFYLETRNSIHVALGINFSSSTDVSIASTVESHPAIWTSIQAWSSIVFAVATAIFNLVFGDFPHDFLEVVHQPVQQHGRSLVQINQIIMSFIQRLTNGHKCQKQ